MKDAAIQLVKVPTSVQFTECGVRILAGQDQERMGDLQPEHRQDLQPHMEVIVSKCPPEDLKKARTACQSTEYAGYTTDDSEITYKILVKLHRRVRLSAVRASCTECCG